MIEKLNEFIEKEEFNEDEGFRVTDDGKADWAVRKIAEHKKEIDRIKDFAKERIEQIKRWQESEVESLENNIDFLESLLQEYLYNTEQKRIKLPSGNVNIRKQQPKWVYNDSLVLDALEKAQMDEFIRIKKEVNKSELRKHVEIVNGKAVNKETGEVIDGIEIVERGETVSVRVNE